LIFKEKQNVLKADLETKEIEKIETLKEIEK
jgi:hypothetical protein